MTDLILANSGACSIILQRISAATHMSRDVLQRVGADIERIGLSQSMKMDQDSDESDAESSSVQGRC